MPLNSIEPRAAKASMPVNRPENTEPTEQGDSDLSLVIDALAAAGISSKEAAITMGMDPAQWTRIKGGTGRLSVNCLQRLPATFWLHYIERVRVLKGLSEDTEAGMKNKEIQDTADALFDRLVQKLTAGVER